VLGKIWSVFENSLWMPSSGSNHGKNLKIIQNQVIAKSVKKIRITGIVKHSRNIVLQIRQRNMSGVNQVMCTARPSWRCMTIADVAYKKTMFNVNVHLDGIISIDRETQVSDGY